MPAWSHQTSTSHQHHRCSPAPARTYSSDLTDTKEDADNVAIAILGQVNVNVGALRYNFITPFNLYKTTRLYFGVKLR